jgi:GNAT superfamily N-acetyltransferase
MLFREAKSTDIPKMHAVRLAVNENKLSDPDLIKPADYQRRLEECGKGWVCEIDDTIVGFAIVDVEEARVWALFMDPAHEGQFIGRMLHDMMITWCFAREIPKLTLTTEPNTRAERFYTKAGWVKIGETANGEVVFELENNLEIE